MSTTLFRELFRGDAGEGRVIHQRTTTSAASRAASVAQTDVLPVQVRRQLLDVRLDDQQGALPASASSQTISTAGLSRRSSIFAL